MSLFSRFFKPAQAEVLPPMEALFEERGLPLDLPELEPFKADFEHLHADERVRWADAVAELHRRQWPFPPAWIDAQFEVILEVVPTWRAEREQRFYRPAFDGLSKRVRVKNEVMPEAWLALWDVSANDVMDRALDHLEANSKHKPFVRMASGVYASAFGDGLDAARLLLPDLWCNLFPGQNTFVAAPCEDRLLVAPQVLLPKLVEAIGQCLSAPTGPRVQAVILQYVNQKLLPANLQDPHPIAQPQRDLRQNDLMEAYRAQEEDLDAALGQPTPLSLLRTNQGRSLSMALWVEGSPVLLPECDTIGFVAKSGQPLGVYFRQTLPRIPELKGTPVDIWGPRRQRYEGFPTREQLNRLEPFASPEQMAQIFKGNNASAPQAPRPTAPSFAQSTSAMLGNSSPVPAHLRGQSLGMQNAEQES